MKTSKKSNDLAQNASSLHQHIGSLLTSIQAFNNYEIRQEYAVKKVNPEFTSGREKFDWVVLGAKIIVECHGVQHYRPVCFGGIDIDEAKRNLVALQERDNAKRSAAEEKGWTYVVVKYDESKITAAELEERIRDSLASAIITKSLKTYNSALKIIKASKIVKKKWPTRKIPSRPFDRKNNEKT